MSTDKINILLQNTSRICQPLIFADPEPWKRSISRNTNFRALFNFCCAKIKGEHFSNFWSRFFAFHQVKNIFQKVGTLKQVVTLWWNNLQKKENFGIYFLKMEKNQWLIVASRSFNTEIIQTRSILNMFVLSMLYEILKYNTCKSVFLPWKNPSIIQKNKNFNKSIQTVSCLEWVL